MAGLQTLLEHTLKSAFGAVLALGAVVGCLVLFVATANQFGIAAYSNVYWPGPVVVLILTMFLIIGFEGGLAIARNPTAADTNPNAAATRRSLDALFSGLFALALLGMLGSGIWWALDRTRAGLQPTTETYVAGTALFLYVAIRWGTKLTGANGAELGRRIGFERAVPDPGESKTRFQMRMLIGLVIGVAAFDSLLVFLSAALAPQDSRIYPFISQRTLAASACWLVGLFTLGYWVSAHLRGRLTMRRRYVQGVVAILTLVPALALDARVPLYPLALLQPAKEGAAIDAAPRPSLARTSTAPLTPPPDTAPTNVRSATPAPGSVSVSGLVVWGITPVQAARLGVQDRISGTMVMLTTTDVYGRFNVSVPPSTYSIYVDTANTPGGYITGSPVTKLEVSAGAVVTYPTIRLNKRIAALLPAIGAVIGSPITFSWQTLATSTGYELTILEDGAATSSSDPRQAVFARRTNATTLTVTTLAANRRYRWYVSAYLTASGTDTLIGESLVRSFSTSP